MGPDQLRENRRVVTDAGADMYDMFFRLRRSGGDQRRVKRGLAVVKVALRQDADHVVGVQVNRVGIRRRAITAAPAHDLPRPGPEEVFPRHRGEGRLDPRVPDATGCHDLLRKGAPDDFQFGLVIHLGCMAGEPIEAQNNMTGPSFLEQETVNGDG